MDRLFLPVQRILLDNDPMGIYFEEDHNEDEYDFEVGNILNGLPDCKSEDDVRRLVTVVFVRFFGDTPFPAESYLKIAREIWRLIDPSRVASSPSA